MYVCICRGVTDNQIKAQVANGATCVKDVCRQLGVAGQCGKCGILAKQIIQETVLESQGKA